MKNVEKSFDKFSSDKMQMLIRYLSYKEFSLILKTKGNKGILYPKVVAWG